MTRVFDDFNEGKFSKQHLGMFNIKSSKLRNSVDGKDYNYVLISKSFHKIEQLNTQRWKVRYFCVLNFASLDHYFAAKK